MQEIKDLLLKIMVKTDSNFFYNNKGLEQNKSMYYKDSDNQSSGSTKSK